MNSFGGEFLTETSLSSRVDFVVEEDLLRPTFYFCGL
jgi:hypothetical protein